MGDRERLRLLLELERKLRRTQKRFTPNGVNWRSAMEILEKLQEDARPDVAGVPKLGPIVKGGRSILLMDCTHITSNLGWPAFDDGWMLGREVVAPEDVLVYDDTSSASGGGDAYYVRGASKIEYYVAHVLPVPKQGTRFKKGQTMSRIAQHVNDEHVHLGINTMLLIGHHLRSGVNYQHSAPSIGKQLAAALLS